jgi:branched-chain amino acid transport system ATP-binding protein
MCSKCISECPSRTETAPSRPALEVVDLHAGYGKSRVLFGVHLRAMPGEVVALLGRNGAGKSTTLKAIMGLVPPAHGRVVLDGRDLSGLPPFRIARSGIGYVPQERRVFSDLSVLENLEVGRRSARPGRTPWNVERVGDLFPALRDLGARRGGDLSGGEQQMVTIARTLMGNPDVLLLDEPSEGLAPVVVTAMATQVRRLKAEGLTIVLSEQNLRFTMQVSDRAYILEKGSVRYEGSLHGILADQTLLQKFLTV